MSHLFAHPEPRPAGRTARGRVLPSIPRSDRDQGVARRPRPGARPGRSPTVQSAANHGRLLPLWTDALTQKLGRRRAGLARPASSAPAERSAKRPIPISAPDPQAPDQRSVRSPHGPCLVRWCRPLRRGDRCRLPDRLRARVRVGSPRVGDAGAVVLPALPLRHLQRPRLPAVGRPRRSRAVRLAVRRRRPAGRPRRARHPRRPCRRVEHGRLRRPAVRAAAPRPHQRRRRRRRRIGFGTGRAGHVADRRRCHRRGLPHARHGRDGRRDRQRRDAHPVEAQEPAGLGRVHVPPARALAARHGQHDGSIPIAAAVALRLRGPVRARSTCRSCSPSATRTGRACRPT